MGLAGAAISAACATVPAWRISEWALAAILLGPLAVLLALPFPAVARPMSLSGRWRFLLMMLVLLGGMAFAVVVWMPRGHRIYGPGLVIAAHIFPGFGGTWLQRTLFFAWLLGEPAASVMNGPVPGFGYAAFLAAMGAVTLAWGLRQQREVRA